MSRVFWKIFIWFWLAILFMSMAVGWGVKFYYDQSILHFGQDLPKAKLETIAITIEEAGIRQALPLLHDFKKGSAIPVFVLRSGDRGRDILGRPLPRHLRSKAYLTDNDVIHKTVISPKGKSYVVIANVPKKWRYAHLWRDGSGRYIALGIAIFISTFVCYGLARYITRPLERLGDATKQLAKGDLKVRVDINKFTNRRDEIIDLGDDFNAMAEKIQTLLNAQSQLLGDISHELRSPLTRMQLAVSLGKNEVEKNAELLKQHRDDDLEQVYDKAGIRLAQIEKDIGRMDDLIGQILTLCKLESASDLYPKERIELVDFLFQIVDEVELEAKQKSCHIELQQVDKIFMHASKELLRRAFENILRNAVYYTKESSVVDVAIKQQGGMASINISDQGEGVVEEQLETIFEPFIRTDSARVRNTGGFGLGMAIAKKSILAQGGSISASNIPSGGLCVSIVLPVLSDHNLKS